MAADRSALMINYYPPDNAGAAMWTSYNGSEYSTDLATIKAAGFNTVRIFLQTDGAAFNFGTSTSGQLANLTDFYARVKAAGLTIHLTLFDFWGAYGHIGGSKATVNSLLGALPDFTAIRRIEIQNETPFSSTSTYTGGAGGSDPTVASTVGPASIAWAQTIIPYIRTVAPGIPVVTSCKAWNLQSLGLVDLQAWVTASLGQSWQPDYYDSHAYTDGDIPAELYWQMQTAISIVGGDPTMLGVGETGVPSASSGGVSAAQALWTQVEAYQAVRWVCQELGVAEPAPWTMFDVAPGGVYFSGGNYYGLYDQNRTIKPLGTFYQQHPPGAVVPPVDFNGGFTNPLTDPFGNVAPQGWVAWKGPGNVQPLTTTVGGDGSIQMTGSSGSSDATNAPALYRDCGHQYPLIVPGISYTWTWTVKAAGSFGVPQLQIAWFDKLNAFISQQFATPALTGSYTDFPVTGVAPAGAVRARVLINTPHNAGTVSVLKCVFSGPLGNWAVGPTGRG